MLDSIFSDSLVKIGPLTFKHQVQKIDIQEVKAVQPIDTVRTDRHFISDSGQSRHVAQIRLLFTGLDEINAGVEGGTNGTSGLRALVALFKICPITSIQNKEIKECWSYIDEAFVSRLKEEEFDSLTKATGLDLTQAIPAIGTASSPLKAALREKSNRTIERKKNLYARHIPCTLDSISIENVPEIPFSLQVTINISRADVSCYFDKKESYGALLYQGEGKSRSPDPSKAFWLIKWIDTVLQGKSSKYIVPELRPSDFENLKLRRYRLDYPETGGKEIDELIIPLQTSTDHNTGGIALAESCSLSNKFSYKKLSGKGWNAPTHMGATSRSSAIDIVFNKQESSEDYEKFCKFKETSDKLTKLQELNRMFRVEGWILYSPVSKILNTTKYTVNNATLSGKTAFVPISIDVDTSDIPNLINCRVNLIENNPNIFSDSEATIDFSGALNTDLREYFNKVVKQAIEYKDDVFLNGNYTNIITNLTNPKEADFRLLFPVGASGFNIQNRVTSCILNKDTLRAVFLKDPNILRLLSGNYLATGRQKADRDPTFIEQALTSLGVYKDLIAGANVTAEALIAAQQLTDRLFVHTAANGGAGVENTTKNKIAKEIWTSVLGNTPGFLSGRNTTSTKKIIEFIVKDPTIQLSEEFKDDLYQVIIERLPYPQNESGFIPLLKNAYDASGVHDAFYMLLLGFERFETDAAIGDISSLINPNPNPSEQKGIKDRITSILKEDVKSRNLIFGADSLFPDLILPTYQELYGEEWSKYAPTFGDLGISTPLPEFDNTPAVNPNNFVSPASWFFIKRMKGELYKISREIKKGVEEAKGKTVVSIPFNSGEIKELLNYFQVADSPTLSSKALKDSLDGLERDKTKQISDKSVEEIIQNGLRRWKGENESNYNSTLIDLAAAYDGAIDPSNPPKIYFSYKGNKIFIKLTDTDIYGNKLITALNDSISRLETNEQEDITSASEDESCSSVFNEDVRFHRNLKKNNDAIIDSSIAQVHDDFYSAEKMFPACKVYLIDRRGDEVVGDSSLFSVAAIKSIDITLDKHDAPLAVIKIADPLFILQNDTFKEGNVDTVNDQEFVRPSLPSSKRSKGDFYKRYKLSQGRAIQVRIGYSSVASGLPIVFTGRITEIKHGDELLIVAQGWKAELFNRQVSFYNDNAKSWGPRDLVIQTITEANPDGIGTNFTPAKAELINNALDATMASAMVERVQINQSNSGVGGSRTVGQQVRDYFGSFINANQSEGVKGLDFRLKNIWYPDTKLYSNLFKARSYFKIMPTGLNDSWLIPIQPAWYAIEEATRHTWNTVADVVPYDTESTLFMGHPDQPYYYTKGNKYLNRVNGHFSKSYEKNYLRLFEEVLANFEFSKYYKKNQEADLRQEVTSQGQALVGATAAAYVNPTFSYVRSIANFKSFLNALELLPGKEQIALEDPTVAPIYNRAKEKLGVKKLATHLYRRFFNVSSQQMLGWPNSENDLEFALQSKYSLSDNVNQEVRDRLVVNEVGGNTNLVGRLRNKADELIKFLKDQETDRVNNNYNDSKLLRFSSVREKAQDLFKDFDSFIKDAFTFYDLYDYSPSNTLTYLQDNVNSLKDLMDTGGETFSRGYDRAKAKIAIRRQKNIVTFLEQLLADMDIRSPFITRDNTAETASDVALKVLTLGLIRGDEKIRNLDIDGQWPYFKAFVYFFCQYVLDEAEVGQDSDTFNQLQGLFGTKLPAPNMRAFRVHHYLHNDLNIISNKIAATTNEMWNTVVIEHPAKTPTDSIVSDKGIITRGKVSSGANWVYWPSQEVTGVQGLQFHPGLVLANKKVRVFTELNCHSQDLAAKLACNRLAEGMRKMYRGNICILGKHIKPHDRLVLSDNYCKMSGALGVESVIHHYNAEDGWITNVKPEAICDSNPSAAVMQTAALEATYESIFNVIDFASEAILWASVVATLGATTPLAIGKSTVVRGGLSALKQAFRPGKFLKNAATAHKKHFAKTIRFMRQKKNPKGLLSTMSGLYSMYGGPVASYYTNQLLLGTAKFGVNLSFKSNVVTAFAEDYKEDGPGVEQLPVILSPITHNGTPLTAGLELADHMWQIGAVNTYYSWRRLTESFLNFTEEVENGLEII